MEGLIHGGAYFRNFTVIKKETILDVRMHRKITKPKESFQIKHFFTVSLKVKNNALMLRRYDYTLSFLPEYILQNIATEI